MRLAMTETPARPRSASLVRRVLGIVVALTALLASTEIVLRLLDVPPRATATTHAARSLAPGSEGLPRNRHGWPGPPIDEQRSERHLRIAILAGSPGCGAVPFDDTFGQRLQRLAQEEAPGARVELLQAAAPGETTFQMLRWWPRIAADFAPDIVFVYPGADDHAPAAVAPDAELARRRSAASRWHVARLVQRWLARPAGDAGEADPDGARDEAPHGRRVPVPEFEANVAALVEIGRAQGAEVCVVSPAFSAALEKRVPVLEDYRAAARRAAAAGQASLVDADALLSAFEASMDRPPCPGSGESHGFVDGVHLTTGAHAVVAQMLMTRVRAHPRFGSLAALRPADAPVVSAVEPTTVPALASAEITVRGTGFAAADALRLWIGDRWVTELVIADAGTLRARVPLGLAPGQHGLRLTSTRGLSPGPAAALTVTPAPLEVALHRNGDGLEVELDGTAPAGSTVQVWLAPAGRARPVPTHAGPFWLQAGAPGEKPSRAPFCFSGLPFPVFEAAAGADGRWHVRAPWQPDATYANAVAQGVVWLSQGGRTGVTTDVVVRVVPR